MNNSEPAPSRNPWRVRAPVYMVVLLLVGCAVTARIDGTQTPSALGTAGTYQIEICRGGCRNHRAQVLVRGHLVIENASYTTAALPQTARDYFEQWTALLLGAAAHDTPNACFVLVRTGRDVDTYAGLEKVGLTLVEPHRGDSIRIALYQSPDASYYAVLRPAGEELVGRGRSHGVADAADEFVMDSVVARRIGPPDRGLCILAAEEEAKTLAAQRGPSP